MFGLVCLDYADDARFHQTSHEGRLVHQDKSIKLVAIVRDGAGDGTEVEWKNRAQRQNRFKSIGFTLLIVSKLVTATFRRIDDHIEAIRFRVERRQFFQCVHARASINSVTSLSFVRPGGGSFGSVETRHSAQWQVKSKLAGKKGLCT